MFTFVHAADVHLDSPLLNLTRVSRELAGDVRVATRAAFDNLVQLALEHQVDFVVIAGDLYDRDAKDLNTPAHLRRQFERLGEAEIPVFLVRGNHDADTKLEKAARLTAPSNVHVFSCAAPQTVRLEALSVALHGQSFAVEAVEDDLSAAFPPPIPGFYNLGILHTSCGSYDAHDRYAPSTIEGLTQKQYDFWALGHIHQRQSLAGPHPMIWYPGNLQGRSIRETGPKGCSLVHVDDDGTTRVEFVPLDAIRWQRIAVDLDSEHSAEDALDCLSAQVAGALEAAEGRPLAIRIVFQGSAVASQAFDRAPDHWDQQVRLSVLDRFDQDVHVEKIRFETTPPRVPADASATAGLKACLEHVLAQPALLDDAWQEVHDDVKRLERLVPNDPRLEEFDLNGLSVAERSELLQEAGRLLAARLGEGAPS